ncbi:MAG: helix-turn-helix domain-containing protein [Mycobacterium sp.]|nr:helix-turn-helix domain-containing protein [Mycobacterium sp.]
MSIVYREFRPDHRLVPFVECGWLRSGSATTSIRVIPDGCVDVFVTAQGNVMIAGPASTFYDLPASDQDVLAGLRLRPGAAAAVFGCPASEFRDIHVPLDSAFGVTDSRIIESLLAATTPSQRMSLLADLVADYFADTDPLVDRSVTRAVAVLRTRPDQPVSALAAEIGLSERQLRRRFESAVGYGPKRLGRVFRFQRLLDLVHASHGRTGWSQLAIAAGYADQSHMINDCIALTGGPPTALPVSVFSNTTEGKSS